LDIRLLALAVRFGQTRQEIRLGNLPDSIDKIEVKALTTPDNDLARKASKNPNALTQEDEKLYGRKLSVANGNITEVVPRACG
jgi:hypothetical protein